MTRKRTGCRSCMVAKLNINGDKVTYEAPKPIRDLEEFSYSYTYAEASNYADNQQNIYAKKVTGADITFTFSDLSLEMEALLMGKTYEAGGSVTNTKDQAEQVAILFQETFDDGSYINNVFYNSKLSKDENSGKTEGENTEFTAVTLVGRAIPLPNGDLDYKLDSAAEGVNKSKLDAWFTEVQFPGESDPVTLKMNKEESEEPKERASIKNSK